MIPCMAFIWSRNIVVRPGLSLRQRLSQNEERSCRRASPSQRLCTAYCCCPLGGRRRGIESAAEAMFKDNFAVRILPFGPDAARSCAKKVSDRQQIGRPISQFDAKIATIACTEAATLVTRNVAEFSHCGFRCLIFGPSSNFSCPKVSTGPKIDQQVSSAARLS
jgi:hypothetical protein